MPLRPAPASTQTRTDLSLRRFAVHAASSPPLSLRQSFSTENRPARPRSLHAPGATRSPACRGFPSGSRVCPPHPTKQTPSHTVSPPKRSPSPIRPAHPASAPLLRLLAARNSLRSLSAPRPCRSTALPAVPAAPAAPTHRASFDLPTPPMTRVATSPRPASPSLNHSPALRRSPLAAALPDLHCAPAVAPPAASSRYHPASAPRFAPRSPSRTH